METKELSKDEYKPYLKNIKTLNELRNVNYIKYFRPDPIKPINLLKSIKSHSQFEKVNFSISQALVHEQDNPSYKFNNMIDNLSMVVEMYDEELASKIQDLSQEQAQKIISKYPDAFNFTFWYQSTDKKVLTDESFEAHKQEFEEILDEITSE